MATPHQNGAEGGQMESAQNGSLTQAAEATSTLIHVDGAETVVVPQGTLILDADYTRDGHDLLLTGANGDEVRLQDYFLEDIAPDLMTEGGAVITASMAARLAGPLGPGQFAQSAETDALGAPIGHIDGLEGAAVATRADGSQVSLQNGDPVFADDILETGPDGALGVVFVDKSTMSMAEGGRIILDEMVYDPETHLGTQAFNIVRGAFVFASGVIGKNDPDSVSVSTPVATIGIRGTKYGIDVSAIEGETTVTLFEGAVTVGNNYGVSVLSSLGDSTQVASSLSSPSDVFSLDPDGQAETYGRALTLHPSQPPIDPSELNDGDRSNSDGPPNEGGLDAASGPGGEAVGVGNQDFLGEFDQRVTGEAPVVPVEDEDVETVPDGSPDVEQVAVLGASDNNNSEGLSVTAEEIPVVEETVDEDGSEDGGGGDGESDDASDNNDDSSDGEGDIEPVVTISGSDGDDVLDVAYTSSEDISGDTTVLAGDGNDLLRVSLGGEADDWTAALGELRQAYNDLQNGNAGDFSVDSLELTVSGVEDLQVSVGDEVYDLNQVTLFLGGNGSDGFENAAGPSVLVGANGDDTLIGNDGDDLMLGGRGDDLMQIAATTLTGGNLGAEQDYSAVVSEALGADSSLSESDLETSGADGGLGVDRVRVTSSGDSPVVLGEGDYGGLRNVEILDLTGVGGQVSASLSLADVIDMTDEGNSLTIWHDGSDGNVLQVGGTDVSNEQSYTFNWDGQEIEITTQVQPDVV